MKLICPTTSSEDRSSSVSQGITRYAIDSWTGNTSGGNTGSGVPTNSVGTTQNFNMGQDALDKHIGN